VLEVLAARGRATGDSAFALAALGSGSDYTAFLDHVGLPSLNLSYGGGAQAGIYHSIYDSFDHYRRFMDTTFAYGVTEARTLATAALRLADAPILPFDFGPVARTYGRYVDEIESAARANTATSALDLGAVRQALGRVDEAARAWESAYQRAMERLAGLDARALGSLGAQLAQINRLLYQSEQRLTEESGLPERPWFRHLIYAPGFYTGYGVKTMPGIREAVEDVPNLSVATREAARVAGALERYAAQVRQAAEQLATLQ
jgi:N-acetylated-alpha-linked acidic dipeptidase